MEYVVLTNEKDEVIGIAEKMYAHVNERLHRAISVIIVNENNEMLLQQRAMEKYHCPGMWANACCTHPRYNESYEDAANRRLMEELGIETNINEAYSFIYKADVKPNLVEHELDHVFIGKYEGEIPFNLEEVMRVKWVSIDELAQDIKVNEEIYTPWFVKIFDEFVKRRLV